MQLNIDYKDALVLRDNGINALKQNLGEEQTRMFLALFNYYEVNDMSNELQVKDYTEWRRTQSWYYDYDMEEMLDMFKNSKEESWHINTNGEKVLD